MLKQRILEDLKKVVSEMGYQGVDIVCTISKNSDFGDYSTNLALQLANQKEGKSKHSPEHFAKEISQKLKDVDYLEKVEVVNGFINFFISPSALLESLHSVCDYSSFVKPNIEIENDQRKKILVEYAHPNTHKAFHIGHLRNITLGESISRLLESQGNEVFRANYQGDIGLHVAKALWGIQKLGLDSALSIEDKAQFLGKAYITGSKAYEEDEKAKQEIQFINKQLYSRDSKIVPLWQKTRGWSLDYFESIYQTLGTKFDGYFFESEVEKRGEELVRDNIDKIFERDQGAIIFPGEKYGLHNRVFITSEGYPTYEAKDMGRAEAERVAFNFDKAIHVVAVDQSGYFQVMFEALEMLDTDLIGKNLHLAYGMVRLTSGKMASRTGEVITFDWIYEQVKKAVSQVVRDHKELKDSEKNQVIDSVSLGAIKFSMLKFAPTTDITFDLEKSVSLSGDSGPYIQYTYARAKSVLRNAKYDYEVDLPHSEAHPKTVEGDLEKEERAILQKIEHFKSIVEEAADNLHPNIIAQYLVELASVFNLFYQKHQIIKGEKVDFRLALTCSVAVILKQGLYLLGIESPERM